MRRAHGAAPAGPQDLAAGAIHRHRIAGRQNAAEPDPAQIIGVEQPAHRRALDLVHQHVIAAIAVGMPDIDGSAGNGSPLAIKDPHAGEQRITGNAAGNIRAGLENRSPLNKKRPQNRVFGRTDRQPVVDQIGQAGHPENVGKQDELLPVALAQMAGPGQKRDPFGPFSIARFHLAHEGVEVVNQGLKDLLGARTLSVIEGFDRRLGEAALTDIPHRPGLR